MPIETCRFDRGEEVIWVGHKGRLWVGEDGGLVGARDAVCDGSLASLRTAVERADYYLGLGQDVRVTLYDAPEDQLLIDEEAFNPPPVEFTVLPDRCLVTPFFGDYRLTDIDTDLCLAFKAHKIKEAAELRRAIDAGAKLKDRHGRAVRPLSPAMIRKLTACLMTILDEAVDDGHLERNPARSRRMRVKVPKLARTFLEMDELVALTDAAGEQDAKFARPKLRATPDPGSSAAKVAEQWQAGKRAFEISDELGLARATVTYHLRRMGAEDPGYYIGRRAIVATLGGSGVRASELCDIRIRDLRLHAASVAHFRIPDAKTEAGIREVQVSPDLLEEIVAHIDRLRRAGQPTDAVAHLFPNRKGRRMTRQRVGEIVREAATLAATRLIARGLPALPNTSPHTLRRTYISIALLANRFDVLWVMRQVGHADSHMTMDVYAQLQQRVERQHGEAFDDLVRQARERLYGTVEEPELAADESLEDLVDERRDRRKDRP